MPSGLGPVRSSAVKSGGYRSENPRTGSVYVGQSSGIGDGDDSGVDVGEATGVADVEAGLEVAVAAAVAVATR